MRVLCSCGKRSRIRLLIPLFWSCVPTDGTICPNGWKCKWCNKWRQPNPVCLSRLIHIHECALSLAFVMGLLPNHTRPTKSCPTTVSHLQCQAMRDGLSGVSALHSAFSCRKRVPFPKPRNAFSPSLLLLSWPHVPYEISPFLVDFHTDFQQKNS